MSQPEPLTEQQLDDDHAIQVLSVEGAQCGDCGDEPGDRNCPDCEKCRRWYVDALRAAGWAPRAEVLREVADELDGIDFHPSAKSFSGDLCRMLAGRFRRKAAEVFAETAAPEATTAPLAASQPSEAPVEGETGERAATGRVGDSAPTVDEGPGWCTFGEDDAPGSGCILPAGHQPPNRHLVTPGDTDDD